MPSDERAPALLGPWGARAALRRVAALSNVAGVFVVRRGALTADPLADLAGATTEPDGRHLRRPLSAADLARLLSTTRGQQAPLPGPIGRGPLGPLPRRPGHGP